MELKLSSTMHSGFTSAPAFILELRPCIRRKTPSHKLQSLTNLLLTTRGGKRVALVVFSGLLTDPTARTDVVRSWHRIETESLGVCCSEISNMWTYIPYSNKLQNGYLYSTGSSVTPSDFCYPYISFIVFCIFYPLYFWKPKAFYIIFVRMH